MGLSHCTVIRLIKVFRKFLYTSKERKRKIERKHIIGFCFVSTCYKTFSVLQINIPVIRRPAIFFRSFFTLILFFCLFSSSSCILFPLSMHFFLYFTPVDVKKCTSFYIPGTKHTI